MAEEKTLILPKEEGFGAPLEHFPTRMQAFIFRNWDMVPAERLAAVLKTGTEQVIGQAKKMGLPDQGNVSAWLGRGYISIIRANWQLLPYSQLLELLGWDEERLALVLKEEDFLDIKLGSKKPVYQEIVYTDLTPEQEKQTVWIRETMRRHFTFDDKGEQPFDFYARTEDSQYLQKVTGAICEGCVAIDDSWEIQDLTEDEDVPFMAQRFLREVKKDWGISFSGSGQKKIVLALLEGAQEEEYHEIDIAEDRIQIQAADSAGILRGLTFLKDLAREKGGLYFEKQRYARRARFKTRYIYSFSGLYNDAFDVDSSVYCPDELLENYAETGINGIWLQAVLYKLVEFPFVPGLSQGWESRLANLAAFVKRAKRYGIKVYLYINEPRAMPLSFFDKRPEILGNMRDGYGCLCTSTPQVQEYLTQGIRRLCQGAPGLGGLFTITRSENITNCYSLTTQMTCPRCAGRSQYEVLAEVNRLIAESAHAVDPRIKVIAWNWSWNDGGFMTLQETEKCIDLMPEDVILMSNRESLIPTFVGGVRGKVHDYSVSICGISPVARRQWMYARSRGHQVAAKMQINNSWECSTIPYLPVYSLLVQNVQELAEAGVEHLMLSWTLGGYPSPSIKVVSELFFETMGAEESVDLGKVYRSLYGDYAKQVQEATDIFSDAFKEFPFDIQTLYVGPQNGGASNLLFAKPTGLAATMTCYAYDDLAAWQAMYPEDIFENQFKVLCDKWKLGLDRLADMPECEFKDIAHATYIQFKASYNQVRFIRCRDRYLAEGCTQAKEAMRQVLCNETELAKELYHIMRRNPSIGFEAANHYYYTQGMLLEKVLNCAHIAAELEL